MQIITSATIKGGSGKSSTTAALAQAAKHLGKRVLLIDLDPQANCTAFIGADPEQPGSYELLEGAEAAEVIQKTEQGIDVIAASPALATVKTRPGIANRLQETLQPLRRKYQYVFIDTPPRADLLTFSALRASTGLLIPLETDSSNLQGLYQIIEIAQQMQEKNPGLSVIGTFLTRYDSRPKLNKALQETIAREAEAAGVPYLGEIRAGVAIREAQVLQLSLYEYANGSNPATDYMRLFEHIAK